MVPAFSAAQRCHQHQSPFYRLLYAAKHQGFLYLLNKRFDGSGSLIKGLVKRKNTPPLENSYVFFWALMDS